MDLLLQTLVNGVLVGAGYALVAVGLTLVFGILGIVNFAHGAYFALGAYSVLMAVDAGIPYLLALPVSLAVVLLAAFASEALIIRRGFYGEGAHGSLIVTFALAQAMMALMLLVAGANPQPIRAPFADSTVTFAGLLIPGQRALILLSAVVALAGIGLWLKRTVRGRQVVAVAQNPRGALYAGIDVPRIRALSFMVGVGSAGLAGGVLGPVTGVFPTMGHASLIMAFIVVILGGLGSLSGSVIGALTMGVANALFETYVSVAWTPALGWTLVILILLVSPQGLRGRAATHRY